MKRSAQFGTNVENEFFQRPLSDFKSIKLDIDRACFSFFFIASQSQAQVGEFLHRVYRQNRDD